MVRITLVVKCIYFINLPVRCPSSGTRNITLETHTCKGPLLYLGYKNCRRSCFVVSVYIFPGVFSLLRRENVSDPTNQDTFVRIVASDWLALKYALLYILKY